MKDDIVKPAASVQAIDGVTAPPQPSTQPESESAIHKAADAEAQINPAKMPQEAAKKEIPTPESRQKPAKKSTVPFIAISFAIVIATCLVVVAILGSLKTQ